LHCTIPSNPVLVIFKTYRKFLQNRIYRCNRPACSVFSAISFVPNLITPFVPVTKLCLQSLFSYFVKFPQLPKYCNNCVVWIECTIFFSENGEFGALRESKCPECSTRGLVSPVLHANNRAKRSIRPRYRSLLISGYCSL
jgi:hypothetical protein